MSTAITNTSAPTHRIEIAPVSSMGRTSYRVTHDGRTLIERSRDPEHDACRALLALGLKGRLETFHPGGTVARMRMDIAFAATRCATEGDRSSPAIRKWSPFDRADLTVDAGMGIAA